MDKRYMALATSMLVLKLLDRQSMYGYQIVRELEQQSQNVFRLQEGTLYPVLHALEQQGAVSTSQQLADNGRIANTMPSHPTDRSCWMKKKRNGGSMNPPSTR